MIFSALAFWHLALTPIRPDSARVEAGRLWVDPVNDLQMRVYVTERSAQSIAQRPPIIRLSRYRGYSVPKLAAARDSAE